MVQKQADSAIQTIDQAWTAYKSLFTLPTTQSTTILGNGQTHSGFGLASTDAQLIEPKAGYLMVLETMKNKAATDPVLFCEMAELVVAHVELRQAVLKAYNDGTIGEQTRDDLLKSLAWTWNRMTTDLNAGNANLKDIYSPLYGDYALKFNNGDYVGMNKTCTDALGAIPGTLTLHGDLLLSRPVRQPAGAETGAVLESEMPVLEDEETAPLTTPVPAGPQTWRILHGPRQDGITIQVRQETSPGTFNIVDRTDIHEAGMNILRNILRADPASLGIDKIIEGNVTTYQIKIGEQLIPMDVNVLKSLLSILPKPMTIEAFDALPEDGQVAALKLAAQTVLNAPVEQVADQNGAVVPTHKKSFWDKLQDWLKVILAAVALWALVSNIFNLFGNKKIGEQAAKAEDTVTDLVQMAYWINETQRNFSHTWTQIGGFVDDPNNSNAPNPPGNTGPPPGL
ncbi:MAG: hypothetical protein Q7T16_00795 [Candidatus Burarchaeum sp.]|nr:hypothetical protein [Candidatus Burarchaeum sp.]MDO8339174.1 hypothetical protein [Candidatus Burarchaeum sp.]